MKKYLIIGLLLCVVGVIVFFSIGRVESRPCYGHADLYKAIMKNDAKFLLKILKYTSTTSPAYFESVAKVINIINQDSYKITSSNVEDFLNYCSSRNYNTYWWDLDFEQYGIDTRLYDGGILIKDIPFFLKVYQTAYQISRTDSVKLFSPMAYEEMFRDYLLFMYAYRYEDKDEILKLKNEFLNDAYISEKWKKIWIPHINYIEALYTDDKHEVEKNYLPQHSQIDDFWFSDKLFELHNKYLKDTNYFFQCI